MPSFTGFSPAGSPLSRPFVLSSAAPLVKLRRVFWSRFRIPLRPVVLGPLLALAGGLASVQAEPKSAAADHVFEMTEEIDEILDFYCFSCHDSTQKGDIRLDTLGELENSKRLDLLNRMQEQVYFGHMPPEDKDQPTEAERKALLGMISAELAVHDASTLEGKLSKPEFGNYVEHDKLFSGEFADLPSFTPDRRWLISEFIFEAKFQRILFNRTTARRARKRFEVVGSRRYRGFSLTNPFLLPKVSGVRYYANEDLTGGHLSSMLTNAQKVSEFLTEEHVPKHQGRDLPAVMEVLAMEEAHQDTLAQRRKFLEDHIARLCEDVHDDRHEELLPTFVPVQLNPLPELEEGEDYKRAPHVAINLLGKLEGTETVFRYLYQPEIAALPDDQFRELCERTWFYRGDHERTIQGRMGILREYLKDIREEVDDPGRRRKIKPLEYEPLAGEEMAAVRAALAKHRRPGDRYHDLIEKCLSDWEEDFRQERIAVGPPSRDLVTRLVAEISRLILERSPTDGEMADYVSLTNDYVAKLGRRKGVQKLIQTFILSSEFVYRQEFGTGPPDDHGRRMLSPRDASYAIAYALTDQSPDEELVAAARNGRLTTRDDYEREIRRLLARRDVQSLIDPVLEDKNWQENVTSMPIRELRFFREFFGYPKALEIFKDEKRFGGDRLAQSTNRIVSEADQLVAHILENDQGVFEELLGTEKFYLYHDGDTERMREASEKIKRIYAYFKDTGWEDFDYEDLAEHREFLRREPMLGPRNLDPENLKKGNRQGDGLTLFKKSMTSITARLDKGQKHAPPFDLYRGYGTDFMWGGNVAKLWGIRKDNWHWSPEQPMKIANRKGLLTHPAWLIAFAFNTETDPVRRGKFVREKLLAGTIPDVPITVDAVIPEDHDASLRTRLASATETEYCWKCHQSMNPLGYPFESYDDFGRFRLKESLEYPEHLVEKRPDEAPGRNHLLDLRDVYKTVPVDPSGHLKGTGDPVLDGDLRDALDLAGRLAKSERVRQSIIRHAFRYFLGRNEVLSDSKTLIDADQAYLQSGGSFDEVIVSLLTSDSFIYRKPLQD